MYIISNTPQIPHSLPRSLFLSQSYNNLLEFIDEKFVGSSIKIIMAASIIMEYITSNCKYCIVEQKICITITISSCEFLCALYIRVKRCVHVVMCMTRDLYTTCTKNVAVAVICYKSCRL